MLVGFPGKTAPPGRTRPAHNGAMPALPCPIKRLEIERVQAAGAGQRDILSAPGHPCSVTFLDQPGTSATGISPFGLSVARWDYPITSAPDCSLVCEMSQWLGPCVLGNGQSSHSACLRRIAAIYTAFQACRLRHLPGGVAVRRCPSQFQFWLVAPVLCCYGAVHRPAAAAPDGLKSHSGVPHSRGCRPSLFRSGPTPAASRLLPYLSQSPSTLPLYWGTDEEESPLLKGERANER